MAFYHSRANQKRVLSKNWQLLDSLHKLIYVDAKKLSNSLEITSTTTELEIPISKEHIITTSFKFSIPPSIIINLNNIIYSLFSGRIGTKRLISELHSLAAYSYLHPTKIRCTYSGYWYRDVNAMPKDLDDEDIIDTQLVESIFIKIYQYTDLLLSEDEINLQDNEVGQILNLMLTNDYLVGDTNVKDKVITLINDQTSAMIQYDISAKDMETLPWFAIYHDTCLSDLKFKDVSEQLRLLFIAILNGYKAWFQNHPNNGQNNSNAFVLSTYSRMQGFNSGDSSYSKLKERILPALFSSSLTVDRIVERKIDDSCVVDLDKIINEHYVELMSKLGHLTNNGNGTKLSDEGLKAMFNDLYSIDSYGDNRSIYTTSTFAAAGKVALANNEVMPYRTLANLMLTAEGQAQVPTKPSDPISVEDFVNTHREEVLTYVSKLVLTSNEMNNVFLTEGIFDDVTGKLSELFSPLENNIDKRLTFIDESSISLSDLQRKLLTEEGISSLPDKTQLDIEEVVTTHWKVVANTIANLKLDVETVGDKYDYKELFPELYFSRYDFDKASIKLNDLTKDWTKDDKERVVYISDEAYPVSHLQTKLVTLPWGLPSNPPLSKNLRELFIEDAAKEEGMKEIPKLLAEGLVTYTLSEICTLIERNDLVEDAKVPTWINFKGSISDFFDKVMRIIISVLEIPIDEIVTGVITTVNWMTMDRIIRMIRTRTMNKANFESLFNGLVFDIEGTMTCDAIFANMILPNQKKLALIDKSEMTFPELLTQCLTQEGIDKLPTVNDARDLKDMIIEDLKLEQPTIITILQDKAVHFTYNQFCTIVGQPSWTGTSILPEYTKLDSTIAAITQTLTAPIVPLLSKKEYKLSLTDLVGKIVRDASYITTVDLRFMDLLYHGTSMIEGGRGALEFINYDDGWDDDFKFSANVIAQLQVNKKVADNQSMTSAKFREFMHDIVANINWTDLRNPSEGPKLYHSFIPRYMESVSLE